MYNNYAATENCNKNTIFKNGTVVKNVNKCR